MKSDFHVSMEVYKGEAGVGIFWVGWAGKWVMKRESTSFGY